MDKCLFNLAGEYRVSSELLKRGIFATITYGNRKGADLLAVNQETRKVAVVEVKASNGKKFVTGFYQKHRCPRDPASRFLDSVQLRYRQGRCLPGGVLRSLTSRAC